MRGLDPIGCAGLLTNIREGAEVVFVLGVNGPERIKVRAVWDALSEHEQRSLSKKHGLAPDWATG